MSRVKNVIGYVRTSLNEQKIKGLSLQDQKTLLELYAKHNNLRLLGVVCDIGEGLSALQDRVGGSELLRLVQEDQEVNGVLTLNAERLSTHELGYMMFEREFKRHGVALYIAEPIQKPKPLHKILASITGRAFNRNGVSIER